MNDSSQLLQYSQNLSVLVVEDHEKLRKNNVEMLESFFGVVDSAENGELGFSLYSKYYQKYNKPYDIVLTDLSMPKLNGVELIKKIYTINSSQKVIVLSAHDESKYLLELVNIGIEQFVKKPINVKAFMETLLHYAKEISEQKLGSLIIEFKDNFLYERGTSSLTKSGENIYLTKYEITFMNLLTQDIGNIYSNEEIVAYYKKLEDSMDSANIRKMVSKLRKKLPNDTIESIYSVGYRLVEKA